MSKQYMTNFAPFIEVIEQDFHLCLGDTRQSDGFLVSATLRELVVFLVKEKHGLEDRRLSDKMMLVNLPELSFDL